MKKTYVPLLNRLKKAADSMPNANTADKFGTEKFGDGDLRILAKKKA